MNHLFIAIDDKFMEEKIEIAKKYKIGVEFVLFQNESNLFDENKINFIKTKK
ncbi:MAG: hypothetical protein QXJ06_05150 [Candidatus Aenigmatarchaeota archaeon]